MEDKFKLVSLLIIGLLLGFIIGWTTGWTQALNWGVDKAVYFLDLKGIELDMNSAMIVAQIDRYRTHIDSCYPANFTN